MAEEKQKIFLLVGGPYDGEWHEYYAPPKEIVIPKRTGEINWVSKPEDMDAQICKPIEVDRYLPMPIADNPKLERDVFNQRLWIYIHDSYEHYSRNYRDLQYLIMCKLVNNYKVIK